jgi:hypothetical protein
MTAELPGLPEPAIQADCDGECVHGPYFTTDQMLALRAASVAYGRGEWRPISEAPRDGSWILLYDADHKNPYLHAQFRRGAWWGQLTQSGRTVVWNAPRWWRPLPPPPEALLGKEPK